MFLFDEAIWEIELNSPNVPEDHQEGTKDKKTINQEDFLFKDTSEYEDLTPEQRKAKTEEMKKFWKGASLTGVK